MVLSSSLAATSIRANGEKLPNLDDEALVVLDALRPEQPITYVEPGLGILATVRVGGTLDVYGAAFRTVL
jgi:hypothetical protein